jgi:2-polyprenyl-6-hydroxyphenyl methylase/3-demethylubiquinone-9 3-methyltransferase
MKPPVYNPEWTPEQKAIYVHDMQEIWDRKLAPQIWNLYHNQLDLYIGLAGDEPLDILDVGCAQATLALKLAERGHRVTAVDIRQSFLDYAASRYTHGDITFVCGNAFEVDIERKFDLVYANQILEHLVYPVEFTARLSQFLKPGGRLVMTTPNGEYLKNGLPTFTELGDPKDWEHLQFSADGDEHFFAYTVEELKTVAVDAGLQNVRASWFESPWMSGHMKFRYLHGFTPRGILRALDKMSVRLPLLGKKLTHQLLVVGERGA